MSNSNKRYCVYMHTVPKEISGYQYDKRYIGITCKKNPADRWGKDGSGYKSQYFWNAIQKYGWENIRHEIIMEDLTKEEAEEKEQLFIRAFDSKLGYRGYNGSDGGESGWNGIRREATPVLCIDKQLVFRSVSVASEITGENEYTIKNKCNNYKRGLPNVRTGDHWCYENFIYKFLKGKPYSSSKLIVHIDTGIVYANIKHFNSINNTNFTKRRIITIETYNKRKKNGTLINNRFLRLRDYLYLFDYAKL